MERSFINVTRRKLIDLDPELKTYLFANCDEDKLEEMTFMLDGGFEGYVLLEITNFEQEQKQQLIDYFK